MQRGAPTRPVFSLQELDFFEVPRELLARTPREVRGEARHDARMLVLDRGHDRIEHAHVRDIDRYLRPGDVVVLNDSKVIPAVVQAHRDDGAQVELRLCSNRGEGIWHVVLTPNRDVRVGTRISVEVKGLGALRGEVLSRHPTIASLLVMQLSVDGDLYQLLERVGRPTLSPYIERDWDISYYQNEHAAVPGSVEAPVAGRHFTTELRERLRAQGIAEAFITLHTGMSSLTIEEEDVSGHRMYDEYFSIDEPACEVITRARRSGGRVLAVGTTVMRCLETIAGPDGTLASYTGWTDLFISPGYRFKIVDIFVTNFHGPRTTRLALAMAFAGVDLVKRGYREAVGQRYLFYEFGDTTLTI